MTQQTRALRSAVLAAVAGSVDTFGYLALDRVFISHMTGNTAVLAIAIVQRNFGEAFHRGLAIPAFMAGSLAGAALVDNAESTRQVAHALLLEAALLAGVAVLSWSGAIDRQSCGAGCMLLLVLLASAVGIQNAALTHPGTRGTHTTHITGPLTDFAVEIVRTAEPDRQAETRPGRLLGLAVRLLGFFGGGVAGALLFQVAPMTAPLIPAAVLVGLVWVGA
ncbi:MAG TPA: YoaK family protein [Vicinamibacterales bacterium]|nr:YoaK family protein [Vicinamibacterales bacterium]